MRLHKGRWQLAKIAPINHTSDRLKFSLSAMWPHTCTRPRMGLFVKLSSWLIKALLKHNSSLYFVHFKESNLQFYPIEKHMAFCDFRTLKKAPSTTDFFIFNQVILNLIWPCVQQESMAISCISFQISCLHLDPVGITGLPFSTNKPEQTQTTLGNIVAINCASSQSINRSSLNSTPGKRNVGVKQRKSAAEMAPMPLL